MKKIIWALVLFVFIVKPAFCAIEDEDIVISNINDTLVVKTKEKLYPQKVMQVGYKIVNANKIKKRIVFRVSNYKFINAYAYALDHSVTIYKGMFPYLDNDDELAFVVGHEIAHNLDFYSGYKTRMGMNYKPRKYELKADLVGIDLMVKAGYNPLASITASQKLFGEEYWWEAFCSHPKGSKRVASEYIYIKRKYPQYLNSKEYQDNMYYQNFIMTSQDAIAKVENNPKSLVNVMTKPKDASLIQN